MFENTIKKIKSCLPKKREYQVHEPKFDLKALHDTKNVFYLQWFHRMVSISICVVK